MPVFGTRDTQENTEPELVENPLPASARIGILIRDPKCRRLVEDAAVQLQLSPVSLNTGNLHLSQFAQLQIIVTEDSFAATFRLLLAPRAGRYDSVPPALVLIRHPNLHESFHAHTSTPAPSKSETTTQTRASHDDADHVLDLRLQPAQIVAQLSLILYGHRTFARRSRLTLDELNLNQSIFQCVTSGISIADARLPDTPLVYVNPAFERMTGYTLHELAGRNCRILHRDEKAQPGLSSIRAALQTGSQAVSVLRNFRKDGTPFWNELILSPIRNRDGELTHFVGIQNDITARVELEATLRESEKLAAVGRLASSIAHEINNPLESVMNLLYLAQQTSEPTEMKNFLQMADLELRRVALITSQSLRFYKQSTKPQAVLPMELIDSVIDVYGAQIRNAQVVVERKERNPRGQAEALRITCFESEIRQVLNNLIRNAVDAMYGSGGRLLLRTRPATNLRSGAPGVCITVADTGGGIAPETMKHLYEAFFTTKGIAGTGLGLWISNDIVARHRGQIRVRSSQRKGSTGTVFELFLPAQKLDP